MDNDNLHKSRVKKVSKILYKNEFNAILVSNPSNIFYLSGLDIDNCYLLITSNQQQYLFTDFRFKQEVLVVKGFWKKIITHGSVFKSIADVCKNIDIEKLAVESDDLTIKKFNFLSENLNSVELIVKKNIVSNLRVIKSEREIICIKKSVGILVDIYSVLKHLVKNDNITEWDLANEMEHILKKDFKTCFAFPPILACGDNSSYPHAKIMDRKISKFKYMLTDIGVKFDGYCSDLTRIYVLSKMSLKQEKVYKLLLKHQKELFDIIEPGIELSEIDRISRKKLSELGFSDNIMHSVGHGVGIDVHELPFISKRNTNNNVMAKSGMVFTIEPGLYFPGEWGMRIEDMVLVTETGCEILTENIPK